MGSWKKLCCHVHSRLRLELKRALSLQICLLAGTLLIYILSSDSVAAQDSQYWNIQYGTKATLLGGAVIGSVSDLSATYYNPGAVSLFENPKLILSAKVYEYDWIKIENGAGANRDLTSQKFGAAPNFFAIKIKRDTASRSKLAISILTRQFMSLNFNTRNVSTSVSETGDTSSLSGLFFGYEYLNEMWGGLTYSYKVNESVGIGVTGYGIYRYQTIQRQCLIDELMPNQTIQGYENIRSIAYTNYRTLLKAGIGIKQAPFTMGLTVTTPSLNVMGSGSFGYGRVINDPDSVQNNVYATSFQDSLKAVYKSSWAIGFGAAYWQEKYNLHFSAEWYDAVSKYNPLVPKDFAAQSSGELIHNEIIQEFKSVLNVGAGFVYNVNKSTDVSGGFTTDFSANIGPRSSSIALTQWNIYHVNAGSNFKIGKAEITLGLSYSFGRDYINQQVDLSDVSGEAASITPDLKTSFKRVKLLFGFIF